MSLFFSLCAPSEWADTSTVCFVWPFFVFLSFSYPQVLLMFVTHCPEIPLNLFCFLLLHSAGVCLGYQLQLCWSHVYAPLFYILLFFPFFLFFPGLLIALEGLNTTTDLFLFSFSFLPFPLSPLCFESLNCNYRPNPSVLFWLPLQLWHLLFGRWFGAPLTEVPLHVYVLG